MSGTVKLNSSGGGSVTLTTPSTASNLTVTLPSASGTLATTSGTGSVFTNPTINGFTGDTSVVNIGSGQFYKDTSGNVGIGTSSPGVRLEVKSTTTNTARMRVTGTGSTAGNYRGYEFADNSGFSGGLFQDESTNNFQFWNYGASIMTLTNSGNLGLGVTPSGWNANYKALEFSYAALSSSSNTMLLQANAYRNASGNDIYKTTAAAAQYQSFSGQHIWQTAPSGTAGNAISFTQAMTLDASGNLMVGTTSTSPVDASADGIKIGGTGYFLNLQGFQRAGAAIGRASTTGGIIDFYYRSSSTISVGTISTNGTNTAYNTSSDQRLKTNITPAGSAIQSILDFPVDQFDWISSGEHQNFGAVAQKAINVIPEMVSVPADPDEMWGIDWSKAVPRLIKTIQELSAKNSELESRLAALEGK